MERVSRRQLLVGAAGVSLLAGCGRLPWQAQAPQPPRVPRVGVLALTDRSWFRLPEALGELGYAPGRDVVIEYRTAAGSVDRLPELAAELVALPVDVIVAVGGTQANLAARDATDTTPIVVVFNGDPVATGIVASWARPGGNITGFAGFPAELPTKRVQLLKDALPWAARVAVLWNPANPNQAEAQATIAAAQTLALQLELGAVERLEDLEAVLLSVTSPPPDALLVLDDNLLNARQTRIAEFATERRLPTMFSQRPAVEAGGLMAYEADRREALRRAAYFVDRILKGAKPADLPVEQPMTFDFVVNMKTARELGITFPNEIMLQVTEAIDQ
jgi:putative ABC transport system substrate-binding protein